MGNRSGRVVKAGKGDIHLKECTVRKRTVTNTSVIGYRSFKHGGIPICEACLLEWIKYATPKFNKMGGAKFKRKWKEIFMGWRDTLELIPEEKIKKEDKEKVVFT